MKVCDLSCERIRTVCRIVSQDKGCGILVSPHQLRLTPLGVVGVMFFINLPLVRSRFLTFAIKTIKRVS